VITKAPAPLRTDQRPLYARASEELRKLILGDSYTPGDRLPSEHELSARLGVSRPTLREALRQLEEEGAIVRRHGVGTFVAVRPPVIEAGLEVLESLDRLAERRGLHTSMSEGKIEERAATPRELAGLNLSSETVVTVVTRVIMADSQRVAHLTDVVPVHYLRAAELQSPAPSASIEFRGSVLDLLLARGRPALSHSHTELAAQAADTDLARALHIQRGAPLLRLEAQLYARDGSVVDYSTSYFVPGYFRLHVVRRIGYRNAEFIPQPDICALSADVTA